MAIDVDIDVDLLKSEIKKTYTSVSGEPERDFIFPTGRPWAEDLGYPEELGNVPESAVESFAGVANPWQLGLGNGLVTCPLCPVEGAPARTLPQHQGKRVAVPLPLALRGMRQLWP